MTKIARKKRYSMTPEHRAQLEPWRDRWIANAMSTEAMTEDDREACRNAVIGLYAAANLPPPKHIVFVPSPFVLAFAGGFAAARWHSFKTGFNQVSATRSATDSATDSATEPRKPLTPKQRAELALAQGGRCGCGCGEKLDHAREGTIDEHMNPLGLTGTNDLSNRKLFRLPCAKAKTVIDKGNIAKAKRLAGETCTAPGKPIPQRANPWPPKGTQKLRGGGFGLTKKALRYAAQQDDSGDRG